jgi:hypothetical protein
MKLVGVTDFEVSFMLLCFDQFSDVWLLAISRAQYFTRHSQSLVIFPSTGWRGAVLPEFQPRHDQASGQRSPLAGRKIRGAVDSSRISCY